MKLTETKLPGVWLIDADVFTDERGFFARAWMPAEFAEAGLDTNVAQGHFAGSVRRGTTRGLHYQTTPFQQAKFVRVVHGAIFDVVVDLRPTSPTFRQWLGVELSRDNRRMLHVPIGFAHGYQTLTDHAELFYFVSAPYTPSHERGVRWNDPAFAIDWPMTPTVINERDAGYLDFLS